MIPPSKVPGIGKSLQGFSLEKFATTLRADFRFAPLNVLILVAIFVIGLVMHLILYSFSIQAVLLFLVSALALSGLVRLTQVWESVIILGTADCLISYLALRPESAVLLTTIVVALIISHSLQMPR